MSDRTSANVPSVERLTGGRGLLKKRRQRQGDREGFLLTAVAGGRSSCLGWGRPGTWDKVLSFLWKKGESLSKTITKTSTFRKYFGVGLGI